MSEQTNGSPGQWSASDAQNAVLPPEASGQAPPPGVTPVMDSAVPPSSNAVSHGPRGAGIWFGAILVLLGVAILIDQFVPGVALWRFWPLIIIVLGLRGMFPAAGGKWTPKRLGDGLFGVAVGLVLLGQMLGVLRWDVWLTILRLWPLLLVALGLEVLGKGLRTPWLGVVGSLILVGGLAFGALVMPSTPASWPPTLWSSGPA